MKISAKNTFILSLISTVILSLSACNFPFVKKDDPTVTTTSGKYLYVASGTCYAGGVATAAPSNQVVKYDISTGQRVATIMDYRLQSPGDSPVAIADRDADSIIIQVENAGNGRHLDQVRRDGRSGNLFYTNNTVLGATMRNIFMIADGSYLITRTSLIEKISPFRTRVPAAASFISNPAGTCATVNTSLTFATELQNGKILLGHAAATPNNRLDAINSTGYSVAGDCISAIAGPTTTAMPVGGFAYGTDKFMVAYAGTNPTDNLAVTYQYNTGTTAIATATVNTSLSNNSYMFGTSAMAYNPADDTVYIASSPAFSEKIEKFTLDTTAKTLTRVGSTPFIQASDLACISGMYIGN